MNKPVNRTELTPVSLIRRTAAVYPDKTAVIYGDIRRNYREFETRCNQLANGLRAAGMQKNDRVAFLAPNIPPLLEAHFGVPMAGGILVAINTRLSGSEIAFILGHSGAKFLFVDQELAVRLDGQDLGAIQVVEIADSGDERDPYEQFLAESSAEKPESWLDSEDDPITINYTSGTTGNPKGVMYTHRGAWVTTTGEVIESGLSRHSVYLWTLPMFHCNGWGYNWAVTMVAGTHVCLRTLDYGLIWHLLKNEGVTQYNGAPVVSLMLVNHPDAQKLPQPVRTMIGGAPPSPTLLEQMTALNLLPIHAYGLTETYGPYSLCAWHDAWDQLAVGARANKMARQGVANVVSEEMRVVDHNMHDVPQDGQTIGEVVMRGNHVMAGYFENPAATEKAFEGGWFHSGDLAVRHADGYVELKDRAKDIIISGGENISTIEVEQTIVRHPAVLECAVVAIPHEKWGERPKAFVTLRDQFTVSEAEIIDFVRERLAHFKAPDAVEFMTLPKTSTGKVQKFVLRSREWAGKEKGIN
jgi:fatty-acyl-CoA synthase